MSTFEVNHITKMYRGSSVPAVCDVSLSLNENECLGIVGESGSGKSTLACIMANILTLNSGSVVLDGVDIAGMHGKSRRQVYRKLQMVFQNQSDSFDPRIPLGRGVAEFGKLIGLDHHGRMEKARAMFAKVGLPDSYMKRYPNEISGGECQRAAIARALMVDPRILICDEITSALDVSVQAAIVELIESFKGTMSIVFISHDLALVSNICDRVIVMNGGRIVEEGSASVITKTPLHPYTQLLVSSVFPVDGRIDWHIPEYKALDHALRATGCSFCQNCPVELPCCHDSIPHASVMADGRKVACFAVGGMSGTSQNGTAPRFHANEETRV